MGPHRPRQPGQPAKVMGQVRGPGVVLDHYLIGRAAAMARPRMTRIRTARKAGASGIDATAAMALKHEIANGALLGPKLGESFIA